MRGVHQQTSHRTPIPSQTPSHPVTIIIAVANRKTSPKCNANKPIRYSENLPVEKRAPQANSLPYSPHKPPKTTPHQQPLFSPAFHILHADSHPPLPSAHNPSKNRRSFKNHAKNIGHSESCKSETPITHKKSTLTFL